MKNHSLKKLILILAIAAVSAIAAAFCVACADAPTDAPDVGSAAEITVAFMDGDSPIKTVTGKAGEALNAPTAAETDKTGYTFDGWFDNAELSGAAVVLPSVIPDEDTTYYAKYTLVPTEKPEERKYKVVYEFNLGVLAHGGDLTPSEGATGETVKLKDGRDFYVGGYKFMGWTTESAYVYSASKPFTPYLAGDDFVIQNKDVTLYAQWAVGYYDAKEESDDVIYIFEPLVNNGLGAAVYSSKGKTDKLGFAASADNTESGYSEFTFYYDDGEFTGRLYGDRKYAVAGAEAGMYLYCDYVYGDSPEALGGAYLALDGFGFAVYIEQVGDQTAVRASGLYEYNAEYDDYTFAYTDDENYIGEAYFALIAGAPSGTDFDGLFLLQGFESGSFLLYDNGELLSVMLLLNGYGYAEICEYDAQTDEFVTISTGAYCGTEEHADYTGEWQYVQQDGVYGSFRFILGTVNGDNGAVDIYIEYNESVAGTLTAANGQGTLYIDGYGMAMYSVSGIDYIGECTISDSKNLLTFVPYEQDENGGLTAGVTMYFNLDYDAGTFTMNTEGFVIDGTTLAGYNGASRVVEIPDEITAIGDGAFNYLNTDVSLVSVVIPSGVTSVGARAFQNNFTLRRVVFLSETPINIDFSSANSPFRWPAGDFVIVVPEGSQDEYIAAWSDCPYAIKGSVEVTLLPEFEIKDGVLVRYNKQDGAPELIDIKIPDDVTKIADSVFIGADYLRSVDMNNVTEIGETSFYGCINLVTVKLTAVSMIGDGAFANCLALNTSGEADELVLPVVTQIGESAFASCVSLRRVVLGENIASIGDKAFYECNIYESDPPLFVVLTGSDVPQMGGRVSGGNIAFRIEVSDISVALKCFNASGWNSYCRHLFIPSGDEKGSYISGADRLEIDGRAVYQASETWLYAIDGESITFYLYDSETGTYTSFVGTIKDGEIVVKVHGEGADRRFVGMSGFAVYTTADGKYTLECDPNDFDPENYENYKGYCDVVFNGEQMQMYISGYKIKTISGYVGEDGKQYIVSITFDEEAMIVTLVRNELIAGIKAADGSVLNIHYSGDTVYVYGDFMIKVGTNPDGSDRYLSFTEISGVTATENDNTFTFTFKYLNTSYTITATVSADGKTFTYTYTDSNK